MLVDTKVRLKDGKFSQTHWDLNLATSATFPGEVFLDRWTKDKVAD
jgi:hypothetical protein